MHPLDNAKKLNVTQTVTINADNYYVDLDIESDSDKIIPIELRIPTWTKLPQIFVDSEKNKDAILGGSKITIERNWNGKHFNKVDFPNDTGRCDQIISTNEDRSFQVWSVYLIMQRSIRSWKRQFDLH